MALQGLHHKVLTELGAAIIAGNPAPGEVLRLEELAAQWDVSRTVIREVIRVLESMSMVDARRRVGVTVRDSSEWSVYDPRLIRWRLANPDFAEEQRQAINGVRMGIEPIAAGLSAVNATSEERLTLLKAAKDMQAASEVEDLDAFLAADTLFHMTLLRGSHNYMFASFAPVVREIMAISRHRIWKSDDHSDREALRLHVETAEAVLKGDRNRAERCVRSLVVASQHIIEQVGPRLTEPPASRRQHATPVASQPNVSALR